MSRLRSKHICQGWMLSKFGDRKTSYILTVPPELNVKAIRKVLSIFPGGSSKFIVVDVFEGTEIYFITDLTFNKCFEKIVQDFNLDYRPSEKHSKPKRMRKRPVLQYSIDGEFIKEWEAVTYASKALGINPGHITNVANGVGYTAGGFKWKYK